MVLVRNGREALDHHGVSALVDDLDELGERAQLSRWGYRRAYLQVLIHVKEHALVVAEHEVFHLVWELCVEEGDESEYWQSREVLVAFPDEREVAVMGTNRKGIKDQVAFSVSVNGSLGLCFFR